jgi:hypothetical protein
VEACLLARVGSITRLAQVVVASLLGFREQDYSGRKSSNLLLALHRRNKGHKIRYRLLLLRKHPRRNRQEQFRLLRVLVRNFQSHGLKRSHQFYEPNLLSWVSLKASHSSFGAADKAPKRRGC